MQENFNALSSIFSGLSDSIEKLFKAGSYALVFVLLGTFLLVIPLFLNNNSIFAYIIVGLGIIMIAFSIYYFYLKDVRTLNDMRKNIAKNQQIVDVFQQAALDMTKLASDLYEVTNKYSDEAADFIIQYQQRAKVVNDVLQKLPIPARGKFDQLVNHKYVTRTRDIAQYLRLTTHNAERDIIDIEHAIKDLDAEKLEKRLKRIRDLDIRLRELLNIPDETLILSNTNTPDEMSKSEI